MKMTSKGTLLMVAGVIALGCSSPADEGGMKDPPVGQPPYINQPQTPANTQTNTQTEPLQPAAPVNEQPQTPQQVQQPAGTGGAGGGGATPTAGAIPRGMPGTGFALTPMAGWVAGSSNEAGIQGSFYTISDSTGTPPGNTTITMQDFATAGSKICVSGVASQVMDEAYGQYWGGGVALDLGDPGQMMPQIPWDRGNVVGFRYTITGTMIPPAGSLRFTVLFQDGAGANTGDPYCQALTVTPGTPITSTLSSPNLIQACWQAGGAQLPATALLRSLQWQVVTNTMASTPFDFCIENLTAVTQ